MQATIKENYWQSIYGYFTIQDAKTLQDHVRKAYMSHLAYYDLYGTPFRYLEIGTYRGRSAMAVLEVLSLFPRETWEMHLVDTFRSENIPGVKQSNVLQNLIQVMGLFEDWKNIQVYIGESQKILPLFTSSLFNVIFIDGDHNFLGAFCDLSESTSLLFPHKDSVICLHDSAKQSGFDVYDVIQMVLKDYPKLFVITSSPPFPEGSITVLQRSKNLCQPVN